MAVTATVVGGAALVGGTAAQIDAAQSQKRASRRAERRQREANRVERARASVDRALARRRAVNQARAAQAFNIANNTASGIAQDSSALQGANSALGANLGTNLAIQNRAATSGQQSFNLRQAATFDVQNANASAALRSAYGQGFSQLGGFALTQGLSALGPASQPAQPTPRPTSAAGFPY